MLLALAVFVDTSGRIRMPDRSDAPSENSIIGGRSVSSSSPPASVKIPSTSDTATAVTDEIITEPASDLPNFSPPCFIVLAYLLPSTL